MISTGNDSVGAIAARSLAAVRVFENHGIDYCCGGQRPLEEACREKGVDPVLLRSELEAAEQVPKDPDRNWTKARLEELIGHILEKHHAYLRSELPQIEERVEALLTAHREPHRDTLLRLAGLFAQLKSELQAHMLKEEAVLFPFIARAERSALEGLPWTPVPFSTFANPIRMMEEEHDAAARALREMRRLTNGYSPPADACNAHWALYAGLAVLERDLHMHIHLENNILFPRALAMEPAPSGI